MTSTSDRSSTCPDRASSEVYRAEWGRLLSLLVSRTRRLDLAEDALSEAFAGRRSAGPRDGVPANPAGWLYATAYRHVVGRLRAEAIAGRKAPLLAVRPGWVPPGDSHGGAGRRSSARSSCCAVTRRSRASHGRRSRSASSSGHRPSRSPACSSSRRRRWRRA